MKSNEESEMFRLLNLGARIGKFHETMRRSYNEEIHEVQSLKIKLECPVISEEEKQEIMAQLDCIDSIMRILDQLLCEYDESFEDIIFAPQKD